MGPTDGEQEAVCIQASYCGKWLPLNDCNSEILFIDNTRSGIVLEHYVEAHPPF